MKITYGFIVDTKNPAIEFGRELCLFMTGKIDLSVGYFSRGERYSYLEDNQPLDIVKKRSFDGGRLDYFSFLQTPNVWNNGNGFYYEEDEEEIALEKYKSGMVKDKKRYIMHLESFRGKKAPALPDERIEEKVEKLKEEIRVLNSLEKPVRLEANGSILIHLSEKPDEKVITLLKERVFSYKKKFHNNLEIMGFRLYEEITTINTEVLS